MPKRNNRGCINLKVDELSYHCEEVRHLKMASGF
jgi:hypothetical protein